MIALLGVIFLGGFFATVHPYASVLPAVTIAYNYDGCYSDDDPDTCLRDADDDDDDDTTTPPKKKG